YDMKRLLLVSFLALLCCGQAQAAETAFAYIVPSCGALIGSSLYKFGDLNAVTMDTTGKLCTNAASAVTSTASGAITNPTSTLTLPSTTTAYAAGTLICTNATVATCNTALASQSFAIANSAGGALIQRLRLTTNDATSTAWGAQTIQIDLWSAAPTFATTGDRG